MVDVRVTGIDVTTGKERAIQAGDVIENLTISGLAMLFKGAIDGAGHPWPDEATARDNGDTYTITSAVPITDPEGSGQTVEPGDEIVWDEANGWWVVIGNADEGNVKAALLQVLTSDEDLLLRRGGDIDRLAVGAVGNVALVDGGGQVAWGNLQGPLLNLLTVDDDIITRTAGNIVRLPKGANDTVLGVDGAGNFGYKADPGGGGGAPKTTMEWYVDDENGDDVAGSGSSPAPYQTLQKAVNECHAADVAATDTFNHVIYVRSTDGSALGASLYIGADGGAGPVWTRDCNITIVGAGGVPELSQKTAFFLGQNERGLQFLPDIFIKQATGSVTLKNVAPDTVTHIAGALVFCDCKVQNMKHGHFTPAVNPWGAIALADAAARVYAFDTIFLNVNEGEIAYDVVLPGLLPSAPPITWPTPNPYHSMMIDAGVYKNCSFVDTFPGFVNPTPAFRGVGAAVQSGANVRTYVPSEPSFNRLVFEDCEFSGYEEATNDKGKCIWASLFGGIEMHNCVLRGGANFDGGDTNELAFLGAMTWVKMHQNHFVNGYTPSGILGWDTPGSNLLVVDPWAFMVLSDPITPGAPNVRPPTVYMGENWNGFLGPSYGGVDAQHVMHGFKNADQVFDFTECLEGIIYTNSHVQRQILDLNGLIYKSQNQPLANAQSLVLGVWGNGASGSGSSPLWTREPLPGLLFSVDGGTTWTPQPPTGVTVAWNNVFKQVTVQNLSGGLINVYASIPGAFITMIGGA